MSYYIIDHFNVYFTAEKLKHVFRNMSPPAVLHENYTHQMYSSVEIGGNITRKEFSDFYTLWS